MDQTKQPSALLRDISLMLGGVLALFLRGLRTNHFPSLRDVAITIAAYATVSGILYGWRHFRSNPASDRTDA